MECKNPEMREKNEDYYFTSSGSAEYQGSSKDS
jgi:hypothetical protein